jgi:hypothetical protein
MGNTRRLRIITIETFKILHKSSPVILQDLINIKNHSYNFRYTNTADIPNVRILKYNIKSMVTSSNLTSFSHSSTVPPRSKVKFKLFAFLPMAIA